MMIAIGNDDNGWIEFLNPDYVISGRYVPEGGPTQPARLQLVLDVRDSGRQPLGDLVLVGTDARAAMCGLVQASAITVNLDRLRGNGKPS